MKQYIYETILLFYSGLNRVLKPVNKNKFIIREIEPVSRKFGIDRGKPIDRYYIEKFMKSNRKYIKGVCLEVGDSRYTKQFGTKVIVSDVLDVNQNNKQANIIADLRDLSNVRSNTYDCIILTQVIGMIDDLDRVVSECNRVLKTDGVLLITTSAIAPQIDFNFSFWRFTEKSLAYLLRKRFQKKNTIICSYGNAYIGQGIWLGLALEDINMSVINKHDKQFQCIVAARAIKHT